MIRNMALWRKITEKILGLWAFITTHQTRHLRELETVYENAFARGKFTYFQSLKANWKMGMYMLCSKEQIVGVLAIAIILGATGAFDLRAEKLFVPLSVYWLIIMVVSIFSCLVSLLGVGALHHRFGLSYLIIIPVHIVVAALITTILLNISWPWFSPFPSKSIFEIWTQAILVFAVAISLIFITLYPKLGFMKYTEGKSANILELLLPAEKREPILAVSAQDHYVKITTENTTHVVRMSLGEAKKALPAGDIIQVHRSHLVARNALVRLEKMGVRHMVILTNGAAIPVSKSCVDEIKRQIRWNK